MKSVKVAIEVNAGIIPGEPIDKHKKVWYLSREEYDDDEARLAAAGAAMVYALTLQDPQRLNWVRLDWVWL